MSDALVVAFIAVGTPLLFVALVSWALHYFVALGSPPARRAAWTAGIAYAVIALAGVLMTPLEYWWAPPLAPIPAALIAFWWWRNDFRRDWIDDLQAVSDDVELATDDWRIYLLQLLALVTAALGIAFFKYILKAL